MVIKCILAAYLSVFASAQFVYRNDNAFSLRADTNPSKVYFPEQATSKINKAAHDRFPIADNTRCEQNEYLHPGDNERDWTCDCKPGFIYFPNDGACYEAHRRGPCRDGEIFKLIAPYKPAKCIANECQKDGLVMFNGKCQQLDSIAPCRHFQYLIGRRTYLTVNFSTYELTCADYEHIYECNGYCCENHNGTRDCFQRRYS